MTENNNKKRILNRDIWIEITKTNGKIDVLHSEFINICKKLDKYDEIVNKRIDATKTQIEKLDEKKINRGTFITISTILGIVIGIATMLNLFIK